MNKILYAIFLVVGLLFFISLFLRKVLVFLEVIFTIMEEGFYGLVIPYLLYFVIPLFNKYIFLPIGLGIFMLWFVHRVRTLSIYDSAWIKVKLGMNVVSSILLTYIVFSPLIGDFFKNVLNKDISKVLYLVCIPFVGVTWLLLLLILKIRQHFL